MQENNKWEFLAKPSGRGGFRFFRSRGDGRIAIADNTGRYPDQTECGPTYLDMSKPACFDIWNHGSAVVSVPVEGGLGCVVGVTAKDAIWMIESGVWKGRIELGPKMDEAYILLMKIKDSVEHELEGVR